MTSTRSSTRNPDLQLHANIDSTVPTPIDLKTIIVRREDHLATGGGAEGDTILLGADMQNYFGLNSVATRVWELAELPRSVGDICDSLVEEFEVDRVTCESEVIALIGEFLENSLVEIRVGQAG